VTEALMEKLEGKGQGQGWRSVLGKLTAEGKKAAREVDAIIRAGNFNKIDPEVWQ
jgi:hypothetical protein